MYALVSVDAMDAAKSCFVLIMEGTSKRAKEKETIGGAQNGRDKEQEHCTASKETTNHQKVTKVVDCAVHCCTLMIIQVYCHFRLIDF